MPFDPTKPVQTRDGRKARIVCFDKKGDKPLVVLIEDPTGKNENYNFNYADGKAEYPNNDLVNVPERVVRYVNVPIPGSPVEKHLRKNLVNSPSYSTARSRSFDFEPFDTPSFKGSDWSTVKLTFEDGKLISSEVIR